MEIAGLFVFCLDWVSIFKNLGIPKGENMKIRYLFSFCLALAVVSVSAKAENYGMAGCGLGSMVFKDKPGKIQILASTTNDIIIPQTSAITSGTSNCTDSGNEEASLYITINQDALKRDISRGEGETILGLSKYYGCESAESLGKSLKNNYESIYSAEASEEINAQIRAIAQACGNVG